MNKDRTFGEHMKLLDTAIEGGDVSVVIWLRDYARYGIGPHTEHYAKQVVKKLEDSGYKAEIVSNIKPNTDPKTYARNTIADAMDELKEYGSVDEVRLEHELDRITRANLAMSFQRQTLGDSAAAAVEQQIVLPTPKMPYSP